MKHLYSDDIVNVQVAVVGPLPLPLGGVSVHVERVIHKLRTQKNTVYHFDSTNEWRYRLYFFYALQLILFLLFRRPKIVIYHTSYLSNALLDMRIICWYKQLFGCNYILVEHDCRYVKYLSVRVQKRLHGIYRMVDTQVFIGTRTQEIFEKHNLAVAKHKSLEAAFLPPDMREAEKLRARYPTSLHEFTATHTPVIIANAFQLSYYQERDLYGFDQLIAAAERLHDTHPQLGIVLLIAQKGDEQLYTQLQQQIIQLGIQPAVYILTGNYLLWPLFDMVDLFVRPTLSDGASVSVQEALHCGVPVIASDVCWCPSECMLYRAGDYQKLYQAISHTFD